jgi:hypothetical protein
MLNNTFSSKFWIQPVVMNLYMFEALLAPMPITLLFLFKDGPSHIVHWKKNNGGPYGSSMAEQSTIFRLTLSCSVSIESQDKGTSFMA